MGNQTATITPGIILAMETSKEMRTSAIARNSKFYMFTDWTKHLGGRWVKCSTEWLLRSLAQGLTERFLT
jgi:hypothetical protein